MNAGIVAVVETQLSNFGLTPFRAARELGFHTVLVSNDPDRYRVVSLADEIFANDIDQIIQADTNSIEAVIAPSTPLHADGRLAGVMTVTDYNLPAVAEVAFHFGLPRPPASVGRVTPGQAVDSSATIRTPGWCL